MFVCVFVFNWPALIVYCVSQLRTLPSGLTTPRWSIVELNKLLSLLSSNRKVACRSQGGETRPNRGAIDGCCLRVRSKAYSASSHKRCTCVGGWRDCAATVCLASVNSCINQLPSSRRPNMAWPGSDFEGSMPNTRTQTNMHLSHHAIYWPGRTYAQLN